MHLPSQELGSFSSILSAFQKYPQTGNLDSSWNLITGEISVENLVLS